MCISWCLLNITGSLIYLTYIFGHYIDRFAWWQAARIRPYLNFPWEGGPHLLHQCIAVDTVTTYHIWRRSWTWLPAARRHASHLTNMLFITRRSSYCDLKYFNLIFIISSSVENYYCTIYPLTQPTSNNWFGGRGGHDPLLVILSPNTLSKLGISFN
jgi:hypothetical protein